MRFIEEEIEIHENKLRIKVIKIARDKLKIALHYVKPGVNRSPNILFDRMEESDFLQQKYEFVHLNQLSSAGGKINFKLIAALKEEIKILKPDVIHISGIAEGFHCMIAAVLAGCKNRIIVTHGFASMIEDQPTVNRLLFKYIIEPITLILATKIQCNSNFSLSQKAIRIFGKKKSLCIYNIPPDILIEKTQDSFRQNYIIDSNELIFVSVGRIVKDKGFEILAEAIKRLNKLTKIRFVIIGQGDYKIELEEMLEHEIIDTRVIMTGPISNTQVLNIMLESNVFVLPTMLFETFGLVFIEAALVKLPSIGTMIAAIPEVVVDNETGILIPVNDAEALATAIQYFYDRPDLVESMGKAACIRANKLFTKATIVRDIDNMYSDIIGEKNE